MIIFKSTLLTFIVYFIFSYQHAYSNQNNGLIWETKHSSRINSSLITKNKFGYGTADNELNIYDIGGNFEWSFISKNSIFDIDSTPDGSRSIVASEDRHLYMLDESGKPLWKFKAKRSMKKAAISEDGKLIAAISDDMNLYVLGDKGARLWSKFIKIKMEGIAIYG